MALRPVREALPRVAARVAEVAALADRYRREHGDEQSVDESADAALA